MGRYSLTDAQWEKMEPYCLGKSSDPGWTGSDRRLFMKALLSIAPNGQPMAGPSADVWKVEQDRQVVSRLGEGWRVRSNV